jgi:single-strand DNA-binding protein
MSVNQVAVTGNLTRDVELRATQGGTAVLSFGIAVNDRRKNASGQWEDVPNFFECVTFGNRATALSDILTKGMKVAISGKLHYSSWEKDGQKHSKVDIIANDVELMQNRKPQQEQQQYQQQQTQAFVPQPPTMDMYDSDIPF